MAKKTSKDYFGLSWIVSLILAIIPVTALVLGFLTRLKEGKIVAALIRILFGWNVIWIADIVLVALKGKILRLLNV